MTFIIWWLFCYFIWITIVIWSDWSECRSPSARAGFIVGSALQLVLWPLSVAMHAAAETQFGREKGLTPLFSRWRK